MPISINSLTRVISIPKNYLTLVGGSNYQLDTNQFREDLKAWEASEAGIDMPNTHVHNTQVTLAGITFARSIQIINGYKVMFEDGVYSVTLTGSNNNIADVMVLNSVSLRSANSAGLIVTGAGDPATVADAVFAKMVEGSLNLQQALRLMMAMLYGKVNGAASDTINFRDMADLKNRVVITADADGNRSAVTLDPS
jgi:hypothetical protein